MLLDRRLELQQLGLEDEEILQVGRAVVWGGRADRARHHAWEPPALSPACPTLSAAPPACLPSPTCCLLQEYEHLDLSRIRHPSPARFALEK